MISRLAISGCSASFFFERERQRDRPPFIPIHFRKSQLPVTPQTRVLLLRVTWCCQRQNIWFCYWLCVSAHFSLCVWTSVQISFQLDGPGVCYSVWDCSVCLCSRRPLAMIWHCHSVDWRQNATWMEGRGGRHFDSITRIYCINGKAQQRHWEGSSSAHSVRLTDAPLRASPAAEWAATVEL